MRANELRDLTIDWLGRTYPASVIVTELSVGDWGSASIDVAAIAETHIVGVEIKGEGDTHTRLDRQGLAYGMVAKEMWLLSDESIREKCHNHKPAGWGRLEVWEGAVRPWNRATKCGDPIDRPGGGHRYPSVRDDSRYDPDLARVRGHLCPDAICGALWRDELLQICKDAGVKMPVKSTVQPLTDAIVQALPVGLVHDFAVAALRKRAWKKPVIDTRLAA